MKIKYRELESYKYQLWETYSIRTPIKPEGSIPIRTTFIDLDLDGVLRIRPGYAWDGPSGTTKDDKANMRASLLHDALCQLGRMGMLAGSKREAIDAYFISICKTDGMVGNWREIRRKAYHLGVRVGAFFGIGSTPSRRDTLVILEAP
jgi:hypothetical protein